MTVKQLIYNLSKIENQDKEVRFGNTNHEHSFKIEHVYQKAQYDSKGTMIADAVYLDGTLL